MEGISEKTNEFEAAGVLTVGTCTTDTLKDELSTEDSERVFEGDGWSTGLLRLQDTEKHMIDSMPIFPNTYIIRLSDMKLIGVGDGGVITNADDILDIVKAGTK